MRVIDNHVYFGIAPTDGPPSPEDWWSFAGWRIIQDNENIIPSEFENGDSSSHDANAVYLLPRHSDPVNGDYIRWDNKSVWAGFWESNAQPVIYMKSDISLNLSLIHI